MAVFDVMISYQWDAQERMKLLKNRLESVGISVWMDLDQMEGNMNDRMAEGVEGSQAMLICFSQKYQHSSCCRKEAEYAEKRRKKIIPLNYENYDPNGWLGLLIGSLLYYDVSSDDALNEHFDAIVRAIKGQQTPLPTPSPTTSGARPNFGPPNVSNPDVLKITHKAGLTKAQLDTLFMCLDISPADIDNGRQNANTNDFMVQSSQVLRDWLQKQGKAATRQVLLDALRDCGTIGAVEYLETEWGITS